MDTRGPQRHNRDAVRRFSIAANPWGDVEQKRAAPEPLVEQQMGRKGTTLVIHARRNHPLTFKTPLNLVDSPSPPGAIGYTLPELLAFLLDIDEVKSEACQNAFLLLHQMFVTSLHLLDLLAVLYKQQPNWPSRLKVVIIFQRWLKLYPEDFISMKMRFKLRALILEMVQNLDTATELNFLREELRSTLRLSEQVHVAIRPPSYYLEQNVKQIEASRAKDTQQLRPKSPEVNSGAVLPRLNTERSQLGLERMQSNAALERGRSHAVLEPGGGSNSDNNLVERNISHLEYTQNSSGSFQHMQSSATLATGGLERARSLIAIEGSIHDTLKAQHYDPFSETQHTDEEETGEEPVLLNAISPRPLSISTPRTNGGRHWKGSDFLLELSPVKVCAALTVLDHINLRAIKLRELSNKQWTRPDAQTKAPNVVAMVDQYNARSYWVAAEILLLRDQTQRVKAMRFFIDLAQECANVRNYFSVFSIIHGLNQSPLFRLQADWEKLPKSSKACLSALKASITEPSNNFKVYKAIKSQAQIPHLAYYTKLCFVYDEIPLYVGAEQKINWDKKVFAIYNVLSEFQSCQQQELKFGQDSALLELLGRLTRAVHHAATSIKVDAMWTLSYQYLPKPGRDANVIPIDNAHGAQNLTVPAA